MKEIWKYFHGRLLPNRSSRIGGVLDALTNDEAVNLAQLNAATPAPTYKAYSALLTQSGGASAPTAFVLENTLGGTVTFAKTGTGTYTGTLTGAFTINKTFFLTKGFINVLTSTAYDVNYTSVNLFTINCGTVNSGIAADSLLNNSPIEVRVYN